MKDEAEQSNPSTGSVGEPAAWGVCWSNDVLDCEFVYEHRDNAKAVADEGNGSVVPLYRQPTPALTDAEREAVEWAFNMATWAHSSDHVHAASFRNLLERLGGGDE